MSCAVPLAASLGNFEHRPWKVTLFAENDEAASDDSDEESDAKAETPSKIKSSSHAKPVQETREPSWLNFGFWITPYTRFTSDPTGASGGLGAEMTIMFREEIGLTVGMSGWSHSVRVRKDNGKIDDIDVGSVDLEVGCRLRALNWSGGGIYLDFRAALMLVDGGGPAETTVSAGAGAYFGFEFGSPIVRGFIETGLAWRTALTESNVGWLDRPNASGSFAIFYDLLRIGVRIYL
ncbi:MAG: hypothetical protein IT464_11925 [Planctomycetes bacterium]|nr:hypothetical protein [Planctomycetota bacterium]